MDAAAKALQAVRAILKLIEDVERKSKSADVLREQVIVVQKILESLQGENTRVSAATRTGLERLQVVLVETEGVVNEYAKKTIWSKVPATLKDDHFQEQCRALTSAFFPVIVGLLSDISADGNNAAEILKRQPEMLTWILGAFHQSELAVDALTRLEQKGLPDIIELLRKLLEVQGSRPSKEDLSAKLEEFYTKLGELQVIPPVSITEPAQKAAYGKAVLEASIGKLQQLDYDVGSTGFKLGEIGLNEVYVAQDVRPYEGERGALDISGMSLSSLRQLAALQQVQGDRRVRQQVDAALRNAGHTSQPITSLLGRLSTGFGPAPRKLVAILGPPGSGKSSALREYAIDWATADQSDREKMPFPILVELKRYADELSVARGDLTLLDYVANGGSVGYEMHAQSLRVMLEQDHVLVMLDGLDEVRDSTLRTSILSKIHSFVQKFSSSSCRVVVTSRPVGYDFSLTDYGFEHFMIDPLTKDQINTFLDKWHASTYRSDTAEAAFGTRKKERLKAAIATVPAIAEMASNPLLLTMEAIINRGPELPTVRIRLFQECTKLLVQNWKASKLTTGTDVDKMIQAFSWTEKEELLRALAWSMHTASGTTKLELENIVSESNLVSAFQSIVIRLIQNQSEAFVVSKQLIDDLRERHGILCYLGGDSYAFTHRSFLDYYCAMYVETQNRRRRLTDEEVHEFYKTWAPSKSRHEVLCFLSGMMASNVVDPWLCELIPTDVLLAARCFEQLEVKSDAPLTTSMLRAPFEELCAATEPQQFTDDRIRLLASFYADERTRALLQKIALSGTSYSSDAVQELRAGWPGDTTRAVLASVEQSGKFDKDAADRELNAGLPDNVVPTTETVNAATPVSIDQSGILATGASGRSEEINVSIGSQSEARRASDQSQHDRTETSHGPRESHSANMNAAHINSLQNFKIGASVSDTELVSGGVFFSAPNANGMFNQQALRQPGPDDYSSVVDLDERPVSPGQGTARHSAFSESQSVDVLAKILNDAPANYDSSYTVLGTTSGKAVMFSESISATDKHPQNIDTIELARRPVDTNEYCVEVSSHNLSESTLREKLEHDALSGKKGTEKASRELRSKWPDARTREVLEKVATSGKDGAEAAMDELRGGWNDVQLRSFFRTMAMSERRGANAAIKHLSDGWPDDETRLDLEIIAQSHRHGAVAALRQLRLKWCDENSRHLLLAIAKSNMPGANAAFRELREGWHDMSTRDFLTSVSLSGKTGAGPALRELVIGWKDLETRRILEEIARSGKTGADEAVSELSSGWPESDLREVLEGVAKSGKNGASAALHVLYTRFRDEETRKLLEDVAQSGTISADNAVHKLCAGWPDSATRKILVVIAKSGQRGANAALEELCAGWPDDHTREILEFVATSGTKFAKTALGELQIFSTRKLQSLARN